MLLTTPVRHARLEIHVNEDTFKHTVCGVHRFRRLGAESLRFGEGVFPRQPLSV